MKLKAVPWWHNWLVVKAGSSHSSLMVRKKQTQDSESTPPRITSNVKQNLRFLKLWKVILIIYAPHYHTYSSLCYFKSNRASRIEILALLGLLPVTARRRSRRKMMLLTQTSIVIPPPPSTSKFICTLSFAKSNYSYTCLLLQHKPAGYIRQCRPCTSCGWL